MSAVVVVAVLGAAHAQSPAPTRLKELSSEALLRQNTRAAAFHRSKPVQPCADCARVVFYCSRPLFDNRLGGTTVAVPRAADTAELLEPYIRNDGGRPIAYRSLGAALADLVGGQLDCAAVREDAGG